MVEKECRRIREKMCAEKEERKKLPRESIKKSERKEKNQKWIRGKKY